MGQYSYIVLVLSIVAKALCLKNYVLKQRTFATQFLRQKVLQMLEIGKTVYCVCLKLREITFNIAVFSAGF